MRTFSGFAVVPAPEIRRCVEHHTRRIQALEGSMPFRLQLRSWTVEPASLAEEAATVSKRAPSSAKSQADRIPLPSVRGRSGFCRYAGNLKPQDAAFHYQLGTVLARAGRGGEASAQFHLFNLFSSQEKKAKRGGWRLEDGSGLSLGNH